MQVVIDVSEEEYDAIKSGHSVFVTAQRGGGKSLTIDLIKTVANGTPLPKGHGRLIDADALDDNCDWCHSDDDGSWCYKCKDIDNAPTIIDAETEVNDADSN